jgi:excisionase family DNA binding protein
MNQKMEHQNDRLAYSLDEVANLAGLSVSFLRLEVARGRLRASRAGRRVLVSANELRSYLEPGTERTTR